MYKNVPELTHVADNTLTIFFKIILENLCNRWFSLVGTIGFEPMTS